MKIGYCPVKWKSKEQQSVWVAPLKNLWRGHMWVSLAALCGFLGVIGVSMLLMEATPTKGVGLPGMVIALPAMVLAIGWMGGCLSIGPRIAFRRLIKLAPGTGDVFVGLNLGSSQLLLHAMQNSYQDAGWLTLSDSELSFSGELHNVSIPLSNPRRVCIIKQVFGNQMRSIVKLDLCNQTLYMSTPDPESEKRLVNLVSRIPESNFAGHQNLRPELANLAVVKPLVVSGELVLRICLIALGLIVFLQILTLQMLKDRAGILVGAWPMPCLMMTAFLVLRKQMQTTTFGEASRHSEERLERQVIAKNA